MNKHFRIIVPVVTAIIVIALYFMIPFGEPFNSSINGAICELRGGHIENSLGEQITGISAEDYGNNLGRVPGMDCPCDCIVYESEEARESFEQAKLETLNST